MKPSEILTDAAVLITPPGAWIQKNLARKGRKVYADASVKGWEKANCFCASGALILAGRGGAARSDVPQTEMSARLFLCAATREDGSARQAGLVMRAVNVERGWEFAYDSVTVDWNDDPERTQADVLATFKRAAELAVEVGL